ncbi:molybdate ABC transporter substrate-binding protein [Agromyces sp. SYSU K20354]|uniref:molybdate ABC transporter substrate-binding protein n=1 Tax=Agromyces cavernae TaxID=2898659 RepID=UPI001E4223B3|nr:molybdate ABC transporter substrate-binding protein [Agromyces cavernae]MCD2442927.1 molybdate ABC transporter substrate-binding protein [Agromyces cavernae]
MRHPIVRTVLPAALAALALTACAAPGDHAPDGGTSTAAADGLAGELTIFAAASLAAAFDELATAFEARHPNLDVLPITYDGSSVLATQLIEGAPADVFASADERNMTRLVDGGLTVEPVDFATNVLTIAVAPGNPLGIDDLDDLADGATETARGLPATVVLCAPEVPCGNAAQTLFRDAGITVTPASEEQNVTGVLTKVKNGEADAGLVYVTDVEAAAGEVDGVEIENADVATNVYPITALSDAANPEAASAFVQFIASDEGRAVLASFGFGAP